MNAMKLRYPVLIKGQSLFGFQTSMWFFPTETPGWLVRHDNKTAPEDRPIGVEQLHKGWSRNIDIAACGTVMRVVEHAFAVRLGMGLYDGIGVTIPTHGVPYDGRAGIFHKALMTALVPTRDGKRFTVKRPVTVRSKNGKGYITFKPSSADLTVDVSVDYGGTAKGNYVWCSSQNSFGEVAEARGELKPHLRTLVQVAGHIGWPHSGAFADRRTMSEKEWVDNLLRHRVVDAKGALAFATREGRLCGTYQGTRAGHLEDARLVREIAAELVEI